MSVLRGTYSIVACDRETGEIGCAVQSKYFAVGWVVPWVRAGVGAVATQASAIAAYGPRVLELLEQGREPAAAIAEALREDEHRETRQLGVVDASGRSASFTGAECNEWAGHLEGDGYAAQGNILVGEEVVRELARAYEEGTGPLAERLMSALEAAEAAGGDRRGQQSAALIVEQVGAAAARREGIDRIVDLRVEDHEQPIVELRRLLGIRRKFDLAGAAYSRYQAGEHDRAVDAATQALELDPDDSMLLYNRACYASLAGRRETALADLQRAVELDAAFLQLARADSDFSALADDAEFRRVVGE